MTMTALVINENNGCLVPACNLIKKQDSNKTCFKAIGQYIKLMKVNLSMIKHDLAKEKIGAPFQVLLK